MKIEHTLLYNKNWLPDIIEQINWSKNYIEFFSWRKKNIIPEPNDYTVAIFKVTPKIKNNG